MGRAKEEMMEYEDLGFNKPRFDKDACADHFSDPAISSFIKSVGKPNLCNYCKKKSRSVVSLDTLMRFLCSGIYFFYEDAAQELAYESAEGGYIGTHFDTLELIYDEVGLDVNDDQLINDIIECLPNHVWCKKDPYSLDRNIELIYDWHYFSKLVMHKIRYTLFKTKVFDKSEYEEASDILLDISLCIKDLNLIKEVRKGTYIYRSRQHSNNDNPNSIKTLGSPPVESCTFSNRMSPSGISMFYGAFDDLTAINEVHDEDLRKDKPKITTGKFILTENLRIINLCSLPEVPSIFDERRRELRFKTLFLKEFVSELSKGISRDGYEHINYVPTQIVTEYFRFVMPQIIDFEINGLIYPSSKKNGKDCCVLFFDNMECERIFELESTKIISI